MIFRGEWVGSWSHIPPSHWKSIRYLLVTLGIDTRYKSRRQHWHTSVGVIYFRTFFCAQEVSWNARNSHVSYHDPVAMGLQPQGLQMHRLLVLPFSNDSYLLIFLQWPSFRPSIPRIDMVTTPPTNLERPPEPWPLDSDPGQVSSTAYDCCRCGLIYTTHEDHKWTISSILFPETSACRMLVGHQHK